MTSWLTFVIGIIVGLLIGWVIDLIYRRRADSNRDAEPVESDSATPAWAEPLAELQPREAVGVASAVEAEPPPEVEVESPAELQHLVDEEADESESPGSQVPPAVK
jgi:hypothetical protein